MAASYNEEELLLRLLLGVVFPFFILVVLRMTRVGLGRWEKGWRAEATKWLNGFAERRGLENPAVSAGRVVSFLLGFERLIVFSVVTVVLSLAWFVLFPQTRPLAIEIAGGLLAPILGLLGKTMKGIFLIGYSAALFVAAFWANRILSGKIRKNPLSGILSNSVFVLPLRIGIWLFASFFFFFPYPGTSRIFALGIVFITFILIVFAMRPILEEVAAGIYLCSSFSLKKGKMLMMDGETYLIADLKPVHACLEKGGETLSFPYSRIMKSAIRKKSEGAHGE
jgi:hypothetical protein